MLISIKAWIEKLLKDIIYTSMIIPSLFLIVCSDEAVNKMAGVVQHLMIAAFVEGRKSAVKYQT